MNLYQVRFVNLERGRFIEAKLSEGKLATLERSDKHQVLYKQIIKESKPC
ncbi:MAG: hypothetical protein ACI35R_13210 [Bacillus sp. (in: firmicutes)]